MTPGLGLQGINQTPLPASPSGPGLYPRGLQAEGPWGTVCMSLAAPRRSLLVSEGWHRPRPFTH